MSRYVCWDFDGTLAAREGGWTGALRDVLDSRAADVSATPEDLRPHLQSGFPWHDPDTAHPDWPADRWWSRMEPTFASAFAACGVSRRRADSLAESVREAYLDPERWSLVPGAEAALEGAAARGWDGLLVTNGVPELPDLLDTVGLDGRFERVFNSAETGYEKPHPRAYEQLYDWGGTGARFWFVGDDVERDCRGPREAGIPAILVGSGEWDRSVERVADVPELLPDES